MFFDFYQIFLFFIPGNDAVIEIHSRKLLCIFDGIGDVKGKFSVLIAGATVPALGILKGHGFKTVAVSEGEGDDAFHRFGDCNIGEGVAVSKCGLVNLLYPIGDGEGCEGLAMRENALRGIIYRRDGGECLTLAKCVGIDVAGRHFDTFKGGTTAEGSVSDRFYAVGKLNGGKRGTARKCRVADFEVTDNHLKGMGVTDKFNRFKGGTVPKCGAIYPAEESSVYLKEDFGVLYSLFVGGNEVIGAVFGSVYNAVNNTFVHKNHLLKNPIR